MSSKFRSQFDYDVTAASVEAAVVPVGPSLTVQSMTEEADINVLMERYGITGKLPENVRLPQYGDFSGISDFRTAIEAVRAAEEQFMLIPARARAVFDNDPQKLLDFVSNGGNMEELKRLSVMEKRDVSSVSVSQVDSNVGGASRAAAAAAGGDGAAVGAGSARAGGGG